jgi:hypothetical protein
MNTVTKGQPFSIAEEKYIIRKGWVYAYPVNASPVKRSDPLYFEKRKPKQEGFPLTEMAVGAYYQLETGIYILRRFERYPCFDDSDYEYENRYYNEFFFCSSPADVEKKSDYLITNHINIGHVAKQHWKYLSPFIYMDDGKDTFNVYEVE